MNEFVVHLLDLLEPLGPVRARRMFGAHGLYLDGIMFAIVADDTLYLKVDGSTRREFESAGLEAFTYMKRGKPCHLSYHAAPEHALEEPEELRAWARKGLDAALRAAAGKRRGAG